MSSTSDFSGGGYWLLWKAPVFFGISHKIGWVSMFLFGPRIHSHWDRGRGCFKAHRAISHRISLFVSLFISSVISHLLLLEIHHISQKPLDLHIADISWPHLSTVAKWSKITPPSHCQDMKKDVPCSPPTVYTPVIPSCWMNTSTNPPCSHWCFPHWKPNVSCR